MGTQRCHKFVPQSQTQLKVFEASTDESGCIKDITNRGTLVKEVEVGIGEYAACIYDKQFWIGFRAATSFLEIPGKELIFFFGRNISITIKVSHG